MKARKRLPFSIEQVEFNIDVTRASESQPLKSGSYFYVHIYIYTTYIAILIYIILAHYVATWLSLYSS